MQPDTPGTPPFWTDMSTYWLDIKNSMGLDAMMEKNNFPSKVSSVHFLLWNVKSLCLLPLIIDLVGRPRSLNEGMQQVRCLGASFVQETGNGVPLGPGVERFLAFLTTPRAKETPSKRDWSAAAPLGCPTFPVETHGGGRHCTFWVSVPPTFLALRKVHQISEGRAAISRICMDR